MQDKAMDVDNPPAECTVHYFALRGESDKLANLINNSATHVDSLDQHLRTPLNFAAIGGSLPCATFLLDRGANPNHKDRAGYSSLQHAAHKGQLDCLQALVARGADINSRDVDQSTPLHKAALLPSSDCLTYLIAHGADVNARTSTYDTPIHYAAAGGSIQCMEQLILGGVQVDAADQDGVTPLHQAAYSGHAECVSLLLKKGAKVDCKDHHGMSPLHSAACAGHISCVELLVQNGEFINTVDAEGVTPLHQASFNGHEACVKRLVEFGARVDIQDEMGETPLHKAAFNGHIACAQVFINSGAPVDCRDNREATPLHLACYNSYADCAEFLVSNGADVNSRDDEGASPLHKAAFNGHVNCVKSLLKQGADVNMRDNEGASSLHKAAFNGKVACLKALIKNDAQLEAEDNQGGTPLHNAAYNGHHECVKLLIEMGCKIDPTDQRGSTPLHLSSAVGAFAAVQSLLLAGANVDARNTSGKTPLLYAMKKRHADLARALVMAGADINTKDNKHRDSIQMSNLYGTLKPQDLFDLYQSNPKHKSDKQSNGQQPQPSVVDQSELEIQKKENEKNLIKQASQLFNSKPKKAVEFLISNSFIGATPKEVAHLLYVYNDDFSKKMIGEYLGEPDEFNVQVLNAFVEEMNFAGMEFDVALRRFLCKFRLPGEAQKIDRMMEKFAQQYFTHNPDTSVFTNSVTVYILAFSTIMLNTDAHNHNIKTKMTKQEFLKNNRGINSGEDLPIEFMENLYDKIINDEIKMETDGTPFANASKKGWLTKQGGRIKTWKRRWFILSDNCLFYFKTPNDKEPCGIIPLENIVVQPLAADNKAKKYTFVLQNSLLDVMKACKVGSDGTLVKANHNSYLISAASPQEMESWVNAINSNVHKNPLLELLQQKQQALKTTKRSSAPKANPNRDKAPTSKSSPPQPQASQPNGTSTTTTTTPTTTATKLARSQSFTGVPVVKDSSPSPTLSSILQGTTPPASFSPLHNNL